MNSVAPVGPAARRGLADEAADLVRDAILAGRFPPGAPLRETELAALLGISRGSVREGLAQLDREGLIDTGWHRRTTVIDVAARDVEEVYALRIALDRLAATTAHTRATPADLDALDALVEAMRAEIAGDGRLPALVALDVAFHDRIYVAAGNARLTASWRAIRSQIHLFQLRRAEVGHQYYRARVVEEHRELLELLRAGEIVELDRYVFEHVDTARRNLLRGIGGTADPRGAVED